MAKNDKSNELPTVISDETAEVLPESVTDHFNDTSPARIDFTSLASVESFDDAWKLVEQTFGDVRSTEDLGDGYNRADKTSLVGVPFMILTVAVSQGDYGPFVVVRGVTKTNQKFFITDGSTGIRDQLLYLKAKLNRTGGYFVPQGLVRSDYTKVDDGGNEYKASTYYLSTSA